MRKIGIVILLIVVIAGCSGLRRAGKTGNMREVSRTVSLAEVAEQNLSNENFSIQKAKIDLDYGGGGVSFLASIRHVVPDKYLISLRMGTGIEVGRIYIDKDTILANDRINKVFYYGKSSVLSAKYGIPVELIPALFGDFVGETGDVGQNSGCSNGILSVDTYLKGLKLKYEVDCSTSKSVSLRQEGYSTASGDIKYDNFEKKGGKLIPKDVILNHTESGSKLRITFEKIETPWEGNVEFIPGNRYERIELR